MGVNYTHRCTKASRSGSDSRSAARSHGNDPMQWIVAVFPNRNGSFRQICLIAVMDITHLVNLQSALARVPTVYESRRFGIRDVCRLWREHEHGTDEERDSTGRADPGAATWSRRRSG